DSSAYRAHCDDSSSGVSVQGAVAIFRCQEHQRRYREKQRVYVDHLEANVKSLRVGVDQLLAGRKNVKATQSSWEVSGFAALPDRPKTPTAGDMVEIMRECMRCFSVGIRNQQSQFLGAAMCSDVHHGDLVGRDSILEQWTRFSLYFDGAAPRVEQCAYNVDLLMRDTVMAHVVAVLAVQVTWSSLANVFPHALADPRLRDKLLQSPNLRLPMTAHFQFDAWGKVCRYDPVVDFVAGLYMVLGNYPDVVNTLESANVNAFGRLGGEVPPPWIAKRQFDSKALPAVLVVLMGYWMGVGLTSYSSTDGTVSAKSTAGFAWGHGDARVFNWHPLLMSFGFVFCSTQAALAYTSLPFSRAMNKVQSMSSLGDLMVGAELKAAGLTNTPCDVLIFQYLGSFVVFFYPGAKSEVRASISPYHVGLGLSILGLVCATAATGILEKLSFNGSCNVNGVLDGRVVKGYMAPDCVLGNTIGLLLALTLATLVVTIWHAKHQAAGKPMGDETTPLLLGESSDERTEIAV
ncbi:hypothetical protein BBJ28_00016007, partial [Nothophytophthora sp. Chile5]